MPSQSVTKHHNDHWSGNNHTSPIMVWSVWSVWQIKQLYQFWKWKLNIVVVVVGRMTLVITNQYLFPRDGCHQSYVSSKTNVPSKTLPFYIMISTQFAILKSITQYFTDSNHRLWRTAYLSPTQLLNNIPCFRESHKLTLNCELYSIDVSLRKEGRKIIYFFSFCECFWDLVKRTAFNVKCQNFSNIFLA